MASRFSFILAASIVAAAAAHASRARFDLAGPTLEATVTHDHQTLGIAQVPNLAVGDRIKIKADLPRDQSVHYLLIVAFLSGSTNPPPPRWFTYCDTWKRRCAHRGIDVAVPHGAEQVLVFLAPQTGGDFKTLVGAVRGRPGAFVRTAQDLNQAMLDRSRLDVYLSAVRRLNDLDPSRLRKTAPLLARSLAIVVDPKCLQLIPDLQAPCLLARRESMILEDGHSTSIVEALTSGPESDLAMQASYTPALRFGYYSPYVASVLDIARIFDSFRTAQYDYIPALATLRGERIELSLNRPPTFTEPKTVLVTALPAVEPPQLPPLHAVDPKGIYCARKHSLVLPVEGAPLVFSTAYAHGMKLRLEGKDGKRIELPARADAVKGGFVIDTAALGDAATGGLGDQVKGVLHGDWGFTSYEGPTFQLINDQRYDWHLADGESNALIVGREDTIHLRASSVSCIDDVMLRDPDGKELKVDWKAGKPDEVELKLPLQKAKPGSLTLLVREYGAKAPRPVPLTAFAAAGRLDGFSYHAGDAVGTLRGSRLDEVSGLELAGVRFAPQTLSTGQHGDDLTLSVVNPGAASAVQPERKVIATVQLKDGRTLTLSSAVLPPRPRSVLIAKSVHPSRADRASGIRLGGDAQLPQDARLVFSVRAVAPARFDRRTTLDVATVDGSEATTLTLDNGGLTLENAHVAIAQFRASKAFGRAAFGPVQFRITVDGVAGAWQPLATVVRLPTLRTLQCPDTRTIACKLSGSQLFLIDSVAANRDFHDAVAVPDGFPGEALPVPHTHGGSLYVKLRDDPTAVDRLTLAARRLPPPHREASHATGMPQPAAPESPRSAPTAAPTPPTPAAAAPPPPAAAATAASAASPRAAVAPASVAPLTHGP
ncbi:MAG: hypothetical protein KGL36_06890 [Gammaproteobacteria bacterium]|nr:hypothetical protein [Gammaproteobacteria bacterium]